VAKTKIFFNNWKANSPLFRKFFRGFGV